jgi:hypothetical protein
MGVYAAKALHPQKSTPFSTQGLEFPIARYLQSLSACCTIWRQGECLGYQRLTPDPKNHVLKRDRPVLVTPKRSLTSRADDSSTVSLRYCKPPRSEHKTRGGLVFGFPLPSTHTQETRP